MLYEAPRIELLNRVGQVLGSAVGGSGARAATLRVVRENLLADGITLWVTRHGSPARDLLDWNEPAPPGWETLDRELAQAQFADPRPRSRPAGGGLPCIVSIPLAGTDDRLVGALQLFSSTVLKDLEGREGDVLVRSLGGMLGQFVERRQLELGATLLREVHHRVKNNLHTVASVLRMQLRRLDHIDASRAIEESIHRIQAIALVHETLSRSNEAQADVARLAEEISLGFDAQVELDGGALWVDSSKASPLALILNELIQNAVDHGSADGGPWVRISVSREHGWARIVVADRGPGWPPNFAPAEQTSSLGLMIVTTLADEELRGTVEFRNEAGAVVELRFPLP